MTILIVDDNAAVRRLIRGIVTGLADQVEECGDGRKALAAYAEHLPDYVLMDIEMEHVDGLAATGQIRAEFPSANVIIVTNHDGVDLREAANAAGAYAFVLKDDLYEIERVINLHRTAVKAK